MTKVSSLIITFQQFLIYPFVSTTTTEGLSCQQIENKLWLKADYEIPCPRSDVSKLDFWWM